MKGMVASMKTLYSFIASLCKDQDMKLEDLQKKLKTSRTTLYRYMKGINQITPEVAQSFIEALNMSIQQSLEFSKFISLSAIDHSLIESREVLDDFLFEKKPDTKPVLDVEMVLYDTDKYLRTLKEILDHIYTYSEKDELVGIVKIHNCTSENIIVQLTEFLEKAFSEGINIEAEQFVGLSEKDYLQNACSFISTFPLIKYEKYRFYYREIDLEDCLMPDSILVSLKYAQDGKQMSQYFAVSFYEDSLAECIAFNDEYMYSFLSKNYESLKNSYKNVMRKYVTIDFEDDIFIEMQKHSSNCLIKPNPCYDKIPLEVYKSLLNRMSTEDLIELFTSAFGQRIEENAIPAALEKTFNYLKRRFDNSIVCKQTDIYSRSGMIEFAKTGKLTDHFEHLPAFNRDEIKNVLEHINRRSNDAGNDYTLYITEDSLVRNDFIISAFKDFGIMIEYVYPEQKVGLWKMVLIQNARLASIFFDYSDNHIPLNKAMDRNKADSFIRSLIDN